MPFPHLLQKMSRKWYLDPSYQHSMPWKSSPSNKDKKANVKTALEQLGWFQIWFGSSSIFQSFLSCPIQASSKAMPHRLYIFCTNTMGIFQWMGCTMQEYLISHPRLQKTRFLLTLSKHAPWTTWKKTPLQKGMLCYIGRNGEVKAKEKEMLFIHCERIEMHELLRFHTGRLLFPGFKRRGQGRGCRVWPYRTRQWSLWISWIYFKIIISLQCKFQILCVLNQLSKAELFK